MRADNLLEIQNREVLLAIDRNDESIATPNDCESPDAVGLF
jgi:hypothetical protein